MRVPGEPASTSGTGGVGWIDVHTHINMLEIDHAAILENARKNDITRMITIGTGIEDLPKVVKLVDELKPQVFGTLGFHPHDAKDFAGHAEFDGEKFLREHLKNPRIVAVGEIGLDYYYDHSPRDVQNDVFRKQMAIAADFGLPIEIHTRDAEPDTIAVLKEFKGKVKGLLHCFTGTQWLADEALALGYNISISGVVTFKTADELRAVVKSVPLDRLHIETDAPFLTPVPFRGKKNEPALMVHTAEVVAGLKNVSVEELKQATTANAEKLFTRLRR